MAVGAFLGKSGVFILIEDKMRKNGLEVILAGEVPFEVL